MSQRIVLEYLYKISKDTLDPLLCYTDIYFDHRNISARCGIFYYWLDGYQLAHDEVRGFQASVAIKLTRLL